MLSPKYIGTKKHVQGRTADILGEGNSFVAGHSIDQELRI
jgi:hypothetical protein